MNRIILIGNGFDLAHELETRYEQFINHFWQTKRDNLKERFAYETSNPFHWVDVDDVIELMSFPKNIDDFKRCLNSASTTGYKWFDDVSERYSRMEHKDVLYDTISFRCTNTFLETISKKYEESNWSGIESEYYTALTNCLNDKDDKKIEKLNKEFSFISKKLEKYLTKQTQKAVSMDQEILKKIYSDITQDDFPDEQPQNYDLEKILLLSFNYTKTEELYLDTSRDCRNIRIHGELNNNGNNRIVFGYGDKFDPHYKDICAKNGQSYLENMKSAKYSQRTNYMDVMMFINSEKYQIFVMGHSCGISDKDILHELFGKNCLSIKVFYHQRSEKPNDDDYEYISNNIGKCLDNDLNKRAKLLVTKQNSVPLKTK